MSKCVRLARHAAAKDALADAFQAALQAWPRSGLPDKPEAWLLVTARRKLFDAALHDRVRDEAMPTLLAVPDEAYDLATHCSEFPDERLKLLFVCAHPAIDVPAAHRSCCKPCWDWTLHESPPRSS
jgi:RNA polymerase sigma-70 factor (ECF subfamily)